MTEHRVPGSKMLDIELYYNVLISDIDSTSVSYKLCLITQTVYY